MMQAGALLLATVIAFPASAGGDASDGHTHAESARAPVPVTASAPRAVTATEDFEVVAILEGEHLVVYVDRFSSNEPVAKARVEVEGAGLKGFAGETTPGTYVVDLAATLPPAKHALTISIETGDTADLLSAILDTSQPAASIEHVHGRAEWVVWIVATMVLLAAGALLVVRRKRRNAKGIPQ